MIPPKQNLKRVLVTDCGSTTTKALLFEKTENGWRQTFRGEAPTTVEEPVADVTVGALNAFTEIQEMSGISFLSGAENAPFITPAKDKSGIDCYLSTSSAGGGLQMVVVGVVREMTTQSAERAALGAGAIVLDAISADDGREEHERVQKIRHLKPDIVLMTGGVDGGSRSHVIEMAETLLAANPRPRFGDTLRLPVIYAGNTDAAEEVCQILKRTADVVVVENVRPDLDRENLKPARDAIHEFFLSHVMSHAPGYGRLLGWSPAPVMPTPAAVGDIVYGLARDRGLNVLAVDIGGATTDVFSVFKDIEGEPVFNRTVSANLGMSYSIANVLVSAGVDAIRRWLPYELSDSQIRDRLRNKMIRPTSIPQTVEDLWLEQAVCREALRLSLTHHRSLSVGLSAQKQELGIARIFSQQGPQYQLVEMKKLDMVIGSGGVLSHAPHRLGAALMMLDGFGLEGITQVVVDSIFMMPHLGVFASIHPEAAYEILLRDCLVNVCHTVVPTFSGKWKKGDLLADIVLNGRSIGSVRAGCVEVLSECANQEGELVVTPRGRSVDVGGGPGAAVSKQVILGLHGVIVDGRNRPLPVSRPAGDSSVTDQQAVLSALGLSEGRWDVR